MLNENAIRWLESRNLDPEVADRLGVTSFRTPRGGDALSFGYFVGGEQVNAKFRALGEKRFWMQPNGRMVPWNFNTLTDKTLAGRVPLIIAEGEVDAISIIQAGFPHTISVPNGAPSVAHGLSEGETETAQYQWLDDCKGLIDHSEIILAVDNDPAGYRLRKDLEIRLGVGRCKWIRYPSGCKDMNEVLDAHGAAKVVEIINAAPWAVLDGLYALNDLPPEPDREIFSTGFDGLDPHYNIRRGEFTVVSGLPNGGKTAFVCDLVCHVADRWNWRIALGSFEDNPRQSLVPRLQRWVLGKPPNQCSEEERRRSLEWVEHHFCFIVPPPDTTSNLLWFLECAKAAVIRFGAKIVVMDPWNELEHDRPRDVALTEYVGESIRALKAFARNYDVHQIVVAHPTKSVAYRDSDDAVMSLYDISDSAHWVNRPDAGIVVHRNLEHGLTAIHVKKIRHQEDIGRPGHIWCNFNTYRGRFEIAPAPDEFELPRRRKNAGQSKLV